MRPGVAKVLRPFSIMAAQWRGTGLPRLSEALRRSTQRNWSGGEIVIDRFRGDMRIAVDPSDHMGSYLFWFDAYSLEELKVLDQRLRPGQTFVDAGANIGEFTLVAARAVGPSGRVVAFEPVPKVRLQLEKNVTLNNFSWVSSRPEALGDKKRRVSLFTGDYEWESNAGLASIYRRPKIDDEIAKVQQVTLDSMIAPLDIEWVHGIKVDIEGSELAALTGASRTIERFRPWILCEISQQTCVAAGHQQGDLLKFFFDRDYSVGAFRGGDVMQDIQTAADLHAWDNVLALPTN